MRKALSIIGLAASLLLVGGVAVASIPDASGVIHGCRRNADGSLRVIDSDAGQTCAAGWTPINWSQTGPPGPAGVSGLVIVTTNITVPADGLFDAIATCPAGKSVISGGFSSDRGFTGGYTKNLPTADGTGWEVAGNNFAPDHTVVIRAECATVAS